MPWRPETPAILLPFMLSNAAPVTKVSWVKPTRSSPAERLGCRHHTGDTIRPDSMAEKTVPQGGDSAHSSTAISARPSFFLTGAGDDVAKVDGISHYFIVLSAERHRRLGLAKTKVDLPRGIDAFQRSGQIGCTSHRDLRNTPGSYQESDSAFFYSMTERPLRSLIQVGGITSVSSPRIPGIRLEKTTESMFQNSHSGLRAQFGGRCRRRSFSKSPWQEQVVAVIVNLLCFLRTAVGSRVRAFIGKEDIIGNQIDVRKVPQLSVQYF